MRRASWFNIGSLALGLAFLYLPIVILVIYSFNASRLVTVWGGWSIRWYAELIDDRAMLESAWVTLRIAFLSASAATVLGTLAALALVRFGRFRGRVLFSGMIYAPLVMPEVITGFARWPGGPTRPIRIYSEVRLGVKPEINAVCTILIALVAIGTASASLLAKFHHGGRGAMAGLAGR